MTQEVLSRVTTGSLTLASDSKLEIHAARLDNHKRFSIKDADYPAVRPRSGENVIGTIAYNLTAEEIAKLDIFEGDEYVRETHEVTDLVTGEIVEADVYIWVDGEERLEDRDWDVELFKKTKMHTWISDEMAIIEGSTDGRGNRFWNPEQLAK